MAQLHSQLFVCSLVLLPASAASSAGRSFSQTNSVSLCFRQQSQYSSISAPLPQIQSPQVSTTLATCRPSTKHRPADTTSSAVRLLLPQSYNCALVVPTHSPPGRLLLFLFAASVCPSNTDSLRIFYLRIMNFLLHPKFDEGTSS